MERDFGGRYVPETLMGALEQLESAYDAIRHDPRFWAELNELLGRFKGMRPRGSGIGGGRRFPGLSTDVVWLQKETSTSGY